jgi:hypothetical protein
LCRWFDSAPGHQEFGSNAKRHPRVAFLFSKVKILCHRVCAFGKPEVLLFLLFPEFTLDHPVVGAFTRVSAREHGKRRQHSIEQGAPQPRVGEKKSRREPYKHCGYVIALRQKVQQAECEQAHDEWSTGGLGQQATNAQLAFAYPGESCQKNTKKQACHWPARTEVIGQYPDDKETGIGHRAGQSGQHH